MAARTLTPKQRAFVTAYLRNGGNATQAAISAGYSERTAYSQGAENLTKPEIKAAVRKVADSAEIEAVEILRELKKLALSDRSQAFDDDGRLKQLKDIPDDVRRNIETIQVDEIWEKASETPEKIGETRRVKFSDKTKALELLGKHLKLFTDKTELSGPDGGPARLIIEGLGDDD